MKYSLVILFCIIPVLGSGQKVKSDVEFDGYSEQILLAKKNALKAPGKLSTGEIITVGCDQGRCFIRIEYKGRTIEQNVGNDITTLSIYEYDFGADGDKEIVVVNDFSETAFIYIYSYSRGIILKLFEKEIKSDKLVLKKDYIEYYRQGMVDSLWNYYQGQFWRMIPYKDE